MASLTKIIEDHITQLFQEAEEESCCPSEERPGRALRMRPEPDQLCPQEPLHPGEGIPCRQPARRSRLHSDSTAGLQVSRGSGEPYRRPCRGNPLRGRGQASSPEPAAPQDHHREGTPADRGCSSIPGGSGTFPFRPFPVSPGCHECRTPEEDAQEPCSFIGQPHAMRKVREKER
jgi:hypothetical protein